jgi:hypothetical protein
MFPKHSASPINGGPVDEMDPAREAMKVDISALLGGDLYSQLRQRGERTQPRFSKDRDPEMALRERQRYLAALVQAGVLGESERAKL